MADMKFGVNVLPNADNTYDLGTSSLRWKSINIAGFKFSNADIGEAAGNLANTATAHTMTLYRNGITIPYQMDNANDGGILRVRGTSESNCILELGTWDDSGAGETIQFNYYPTTSQVTPTYSVTVPKKSGTIALAGEAQPANGGNADTVDTFHAGTGNGEVLTLVSWPGIATLQSEGFLTTDYGTADHGHPDQEFLQAICRWAIAHYAGKGATLMGAIGPNSSGTCIMHLYTSSGKDTTSLLPRYCSAIYITLSGYIYNFGCNNYTWYYRQVAAGSVAWSNVSGKPSTFAPSAHDHSRLLDAGNSTVTTMAYSKSGLAYSDYTWLAGWNGYELRAINKSQFAQASHSHEYLPLSGGTLTGTLISKAGAFTASNSNTYPGGGYQGTSKPNITFIGDPTYGISTLEFLSQKGDTSINKPSDCAYIQFQPYGHTALSAVGSAPTLGTTGEANKLIIGVNNDADDMIYLQTPATTGLRHISGASNYIIPSISGSTTTANYPLVSTTTGGVYANNTSVTMNGGTITATSFVGALTGNVTGNVTGSSGSCTGNAATATKATNDSAGTNISSYLQKNLGADNFVTFTVGGDANTYYPVVIGSPSSYYPGQFVSITRSYSETGPDTWNTATHRGGLTLTLYWNGSRYWDGNSAGGDCYLFDLQQTYSTMVANLGNSTGGKVVWLRGGGAVYHAFSMMGTKLSVTVYLTDYTDSAKQVFSPTTTVTPLTKSLPINVSGSAGSVAWGNVSSKPSTYPPTIGTTATTAAAGNHTHSQYLTAHQDISGKLDKSGGTMTGGLLFNASATSGPVASTPTALSYGRLQAYGTLCINGNTDNSGTEYVIITAGKGMSSSTADGLAIGTDTLTWKGNNVIYTHPSYTAKASGLYKVTVDATGHVSAATAVTKADITALGIPGSDTNTNTAHTTFAWTGGTTAGPTGSLSGNHTAVSFGAIPSASASASGIVTTGAQTFAGNKSFAYITVLAQNSTHEGGEIVLNPATSSFKPVYLDSYDNTFRIHEGTNVRLTLGMTDGSLTCAKVYGAVWNDYAEYRNQKEEVEPGYVVLEQDDGKLIKSTARLQKGGAIVSDTFGFAIGETDDNKTPLAVSGRVLAYTYEPHEMFHAGDAVCTGPNGKVSLMTEEEEERYPLRCIGIVSEIPDYEEWGTGKVKVNGRIWIKIR